MSKRSILLGVSSDLSKRSILLVVSTDCADALDGRVFASIPFDRVVLERLKQRTRCFSRAKEAYPDLYETYEFHCLPQWFGTGATQDYDDQADRNKLQPLSYDAEFSEGEPCDESLGDGLDRLEAQEINSLVVPAVELPSTGNLHTECDQLVMSLWGHAFDIVELFEVLATALVKPLRQPSSTVDVWSEGDNCPVQTIQLPGGECRSHWKGVMSTTNLAISTSFSSRSSRTVRTSSSPSASITREYSLPSTVTSNSCSSLVSLSR